MNNKEGNTYQNVSQEELASKAQLDRSNMGRIERGRKNLTILKLHEICDAFEVSPATFPIKHC
ncbi:helix-turn-helix domain-containing protein [Zhongshania marina]|uniref:Transcriptional regulator n=1 Tax=Zhongshania marina TaxID=2304603 RepID=A0A2S4HF33_9GAMM|nr:helix-turn-helix transcriptional regulator [Marortus luteolus]POP52596.1 transcriptional regulator [Marortus luteolus]